MMAIFQRQSVIKYGKQILDPTHVSLIGFSACVSHGETNYIVEADLLIQTKEDGWVILEVDKDTATIASSVRQSTIDYANTLPSLTADGHLVYLIPENICYKRFNGEWIETVAITIGRIVNSRFDKQAVGSQLGAVENVSASRIFFDNAGLPLVFRNGNRFRFAIIDDDNIKLESGLMHFSFNGSVDFGVCTEDIPEFSIISFSDGGIGLYDGTRSPIGISIKDCRAGEKIVFVASGYVYNKNWEFHWSDYLVYVYDNGVIGQGVDISQNYLQSCGKAINSQSLFIDFPQRIKIIENEDV
jgi:hypothetical protein